MKVYKVVVLRGNCEVEDPVLHKKLFEVESELEELEDKIEEELNRRMLRDCDYVGYYVDNITDEELAQLEKFRQANLEAYRRTHKSDAR